LSYLPAHPNDEQVLRESFPPVIAHELHVADVPPSGVHDGPLSPAPLLLLAPLLELLLAPLLLPEPLPLELLLVPLLLPVPVSSLGPASMTIGPGLLSLLLHATAAAEPAIAISAIAESFTIIGFVFITWPRSSQIGTSASRRCRSYSRWRGCKPCTYGR
jgi:hypothetical protein